jgi:cytochrome b561
LGPQRPAHRATNRRLDCHLAYRAPITVFGLFELPPIWPENRAFSEQLFYVHALLGIAIACLVAAHIGAAMYHHFVCRDRILLRMITG